MYLEVIPDPFGAEMESERDNIKVGERRAKIDKMERRMEARPKLVKTYGMF